MKRKYRYLIRATILTGEHKGETYLMRKGGFITDESRYEWEGTTYKTFGIACRRCKQLEEDNALNYSIESQDRERRAKQGKEVSSWRLYEREEYNPYCVEI